MVRRVATAMQKLLAPLGCAAFLCVFAGCIGGAQPVPPALHPDVLADASVDFGGSASVEDAGVYPASDAGAPPPDDTRTDFESTPAAGAADVAGIDWRWRPFFAPPLSADAGVVDAPDAGPPDEAADAH